MEFTPSPSSIFQNKKIKYNNKKPTKNGIIWINFSKIRKAARCTLTPLSLRSARLTQYMRFALCTSLSHILLRFTTQNLAYTRTLSDILALLKQILLESANQQTKGGVVMTLYTALVIQNPANDIRCEPYSQHKKTKKWAGAINLYHTESFHTTLLSSEPIFESSEAAVAYMEDVVKQVKALDLAVA